MKKLTLLIIAIVFFINASSSKDVYTKEKKSTDQSDNWGISLNGEDWKLVQFETGQGMKQKAFADGYPEQEAIQCIVPGDVHWDLERNGKIPPIYYGTNSQNIGWISGKEWWYRKTFSVPDKWKDKNIRLHFDGVDYLADVWLNGNYIGQHEGQMTPFEFEVTNQLKHRKENILTVMIHPAPDNVRKVVPTIDTVQNRIIYRPIMVAMREAYPCWKSNLTAGWDFGANIITMGIWKDVRLVASKDVYLTKPIVLPRLSTPYDKAVLETRINVFSEKPQTVKLNYHIRCLTAQDKRVVTSQKINLKAGDQQVIFSVNIPHPQLWWPNGYGKQHLYEMEITVNVTGNIQESHASKTIFGIRDLQVLKNPEPFTFEQISKPFKNKYGYEPDFLNDTTSNGLGQYKYLIQINGRRIFARGCNWVPCDLLYGRPRRDHYEYLIRSAAEANCNLFRVWGGGVIEKTDFYELCDQYGILLFHDFPWAGPRPADTDEALAISDRETREILPLLMNHPSVVRYCGGNEWKLTSKTNRHVGQQRKICNELDPTRSFHDPDHEVPFQRHGDYFYHPNVYNTYNSKDWNPMEWTEFGLAGAASFETLKEIMPEKDIWPVSSQNANWICHHAFYAYGKDQWLGTEGYKTLFGEPNDVQTLVQYSQFVQAEGLRYACQSMRRFRWHRSACATWVFNEPWPNVAHDAIVEYYGRKSMAYYYLKQAYAPVDISAIYSSLEVGINKPVAIELWGINDHLQPLSGYLCRYRITNLYGKILEEQQISAEVPSEGNVKIGDVKWIPPAEMAGETVLLWLDLIDSSGKAVAQHVYTFGIGKQKEDKNPLLSAMLKMSKTNLESQIVSCNTNEKGEKKLTIKVVNRGQSPALFVKLDVVTPDVTDLSKNPLLDWVYFNENYFSLMPAEERYVQVTFTSNAPKHPVLRIGAWNADANELSGI